MSLASMNTLGMMKQKAETRWINGAVGPPWCQAFLTKPEDWARTDGGSMAQADSWKPNL